MENKNIILALCEAKKEFKPILKNKINPHFKNEYADLQSFLDSTQDALSKHGLFITQVIQERGLVTTINYAYSNETIISVIELKDCQTPQAYGSQLTYYRRYAYSAILGLASEDDDANESSKTPIKTEQKKIEPVKQIVKPATEEPAKVSEKKLEHFKKIITASTLTDDKLIAFIRKAKTSLDEKYPDALDYKECVDWFNTKITELEGQK